MHKAVQNTARQRQAALSGLTKSSRAKRRVVLFAGVAALLLVAFAWIDGGEEPLHTIVQPVAVPGEGSVL
ncbi:MAG: hypothetical protein AAFY19_12285 [Pseudomonadota bacterium]